MSRVSENMKRQAATKRVKDFAVIARRNSLNSKTASLRRIAAEEPNEVAKALQELSKLFADVSTILTGLSGDTSNLRLNLDLGEQKTAGLRDRIAARRKYAKTLRQIANEAPQELGEALSEVWTKLDEAADGIEALAENFGLPLDTQQHERQVENKEMSEAASPESAPAEPAEEPLT